MKGSVYLFIAIILSSVFLGVNFQSAYAIETLTVTPSGSDLAATSDCGSIQASESTVWFNCSGKLYAFNEGTFVFIDDIVTAAGINEDKLLACTVGNCVWFKQTSNDITEYTIVSNVITQTANVDPACGSLGDGMNYDVLGFIWVTCTATDQVVRINPNTNTVVFTSADLTDGAGIECDAPEYVYYEPSVDIGIIMCDTTNNFVSFRLTSVLLDSEPITFDTSDSIVVDTNHNRIMVLGNGFGGIDTWTYDNSGIFTASTQNVGTASDYFGCYIEPILFSGTGIMGCQSTVGTMAFFHSNSTGFFETVSVGQDATATPTLISEFGVGLDLTDSRWYFGGGTDNPTWTQNTDVSRSDEGEDPDPPPPPEEEDPNIIGGVDCSLPENENKLICRVTDPIGGAGNFVIGNGTSGLTGIGCSLGLVDCVNDPNPRTNGLGLLIFIASLFVIIASFYLTIGREAFTIPIYIWIVIILALSAFFTITGLIDPIFLILTAVALVALAASRLKNVILGGSTMGEGSSA